MARRRTMTLSLSEGEYGELISAISYLSTQYEDDVDTNAPGAIARARKLDDARVRLVLAWDRAGLALSEYHAGWVRGLVETYGPDSIRAAIERETKR